MTRKDAVKAGRQIARKRNTEMYVVVSEDGYDWASEEHLEGYYLGATVVYEIHPDGTLQ